MRRFTLGAAFLVAALIATAAPARSRLMVASPGISPDEG